MVCKDYGEDQVKKNDDGNHPLPSNERIIVGFNQRDKTVDDVQKVTVSAIGQSIAEGEFDNVATLLMNLENAGIACNLITYNAAISAYEKAGGEQGMANALRLLNKMKHKQVEPDTITYSAVISACEKAGGQRGMINALNLLQQMKAVQVAPNIPSLIRQ